MLPHFITGGAVLGSKPVHLDQFEGIPVWGPRF